MRELRLFRRRMMVRIARMQTTGASSTEASLQQLSALAEALIVAARDWLWQACCVEFGTPAMRRRAAAAADPGMGKLGGGELNFF